MALGSMSGPVLPHVGSGASLQHLEACPDSSGPQIFPVFLKGIFAPLNLCTARLGWVEEMDLCR
jgi:hypothetical protein